jgi:hypothetical protein
MPNTRIIIQKTMTIASYHVGTPVHSAREEGGAATRREGSSAHRGQGGAHPRAGWTRR